MDHDEHIDNHFDGGANITLKRVSREPSAVRRRSILSILLILMTMILTAAVELDLNIMSIYYSFCRNLEFGSRFGASNPDFRPLSS